MKYFIVTKEAYWVEVDMIGVKDGKIYYIFDFESKLEHLDSCEELFKRELLKKDWVNPFELERQHTLNKIRDCIEKYPYLSKSIPFEKSDLIEMEIKEITEEEFFVELVKLRLK